MLKRTEVYRPRRKHGSVGKEVESQRGGVRWLGLLDIIESLRFDFFFSSRRRHTRLQGDWSSDVCSSDLRTPSSLLQVTSLVIRPRTLSATPMVTVMGAISASSRPAAWAAQAFCWLAAPYSSMASRPMP